MSTKRLTNEEFQIRLKNFRDNGQDVYTDEEYTKGTDELDFYCSKGHHWMARPTDVMHTHTGCPYCSNRKILIGFNDLWTTHPNVASLLKNPNNGYLYTAGSNKSDEFECPNCHHISIKQIAHMCTRGFTCNQCGDSVSYPNKFARALLKQLPVYNIHFEWKPDWLKPYSYDNYFEYDNKFYVLEMDGNMGHGNCDKHEYIRKSGMFGKELDNYKDKLALEHNVSVIRINCAYRDTYKRDNYIINNIFASDLSNLFDLHNVDWDVCNKFAESSIVCEVSRMYDDGMSVGQIAEFTNYSRTSVKNWLKQGAKIHINSYNIKDSIARGRCKRRDIRCSIGVDQYDLDGNFINHYESFCSVKTITGIPSSTFSYYKRHGKTEFVYHNFLWKINV